jgi:hypothetical protein
MDFKSIDFFIGFFLMNAMPHMLFGLYQIRFLSLFGFSASGNLAYALINVVVAFVLFSTSDAQPLAFGVILGAGAILLAYLLTGKFFYRKFHLEGGTA